MKFRFFALYNISGLSPDTEREPISIYSAPERSSSAYLTSRPDTPCELLDKRGAIAYGLLTAIFRPSGEGSFEERLTRKVEEIRLERCKKYPSQVFLVFEGQGDSPPFEPGAKRDAGPFTLVLDGVPKEEIQRAYQQPISSVIAALAIAFDNFQGACKISEGIVFFEEDGRPCFGFNVEMGSANLFVSRKPETAQIELSRSLAIEGLRGDGLNSVFRLLIESYDPVQEPLRQFLAAWMALEIFINKNFATYEHQFTSEFASKLTNPMRDQYVKRINDVMRTQYKFLDRFVVVSAKLCPEDADSDYAVICPAHKLRNEFSHGTPIPERNLPTAMLQKILRRFLKQHIERQRVGSI